MNNEVTISDMLTYWIITALKDLKIYSLPVEDVSKLSEWLVKEGVVFPSLCKCTEECRNKTQAEVNSMVLDNL